MTSIIVSVGGPHRFAELSPRVRNPVNLCFWNLGSWVGTQPVQELETREKAS